MSRHMGGIGRTVTARIEGRVYRIPELWLVGATQGGATVLQAVQRWHEQTLMGEAYERQQEPSA